MALNLFSKKNEAAVKKDGFFVYKKESGELKGTIEEKKYKTFTIGEPHPYDFKITEKLYQEFGFCTAVVDKITNFVWGSGFTIKAEDERDKKIIDEWMQSVNFPYHGRKWLKQALKKGPSYLEIGGKENEVPKAIKVISANRMFIERNSKGTIQSFKLAKTSMASEKDFINFEPYQIAFLPINDSEEEPYGVGIIYPNIKTINDFLGSMKDHHKIVSRKANNPIIAKVGTKEEPPGKTDVENVGASMEQLSNTSNWAVGPDIEFTVLNTGDPGKNFDSVLQNDMSLLITGFQTPEVLLGKGNIPEGLAGVQMDDFERLAKSLQTQIEFIVENQIFPRILAGKQRKGKISFVWNQPSHDDIKTRITQLTALLSNPNLNPKLLEQVEFQLAEILGINKKDITLSASEREAEMKKKTPPIPGNNNEGLDVSGILL